jgi:CRP-like cAMP-binding protein
VRSREHEAMMAAYLKFNVQTFYDFKMDLLLSIQERLQISEYKRGQLVIEEGNLGDCMYIIAKGIA